MDHIGQMGDPAYRLEDHTSPHDLSIRNLREGMLEEATAGEPINERIRPPLNPKTPCRIGCINVRTMYRTGTGVLVEQEIRRYGLEVTGLSEVRWHGKGKVKIGETTFIYSGVEEGPHERGVAIALSRKTEQMVDSYGCITERLIWVRLKSRHLNMMIIQAYAPTEDSDDEIKDDFYEQLSHVIGQVKRHDMLVLMGDFNAKVGCDEDRVWDGVVGKFGVGVRNNNGERLVELCAMSGLKIMNTVFRHKPEHKLTWLSADGHTQNLIDYVIVNKKWCQSVLDTRVFRGCKIPSDHKLVVAKLRVKFRADKGQDKRKLDVDKLRRKEVQQEYAVKIENKFQALDGRNDMDMEEQWTVIRDGINSVAKEVLGYRKKNSKPWVSERSIKLSEEQNNIRIALEDSRDGERRAELRRERGVALRNMHRSLKNDQNKYWEDVAVEIEEAGRRGDSYGMFAAVKLVKRCKQMQFRGGAGVRDEGGELRTSSKEKSEVFKKYFEKLYNPENDVNENVLNEFSRMEQEDLEDIRMEEVKAAMKTLKNRKAAGVCGILPEMLKGGGRAVERVMLQLFNGVLRSGYIPEDWKRAIIVPIYKNKGSKEECGNYRGVSLLSVPGKLFMRVILNRIKDNVENRLREEQAGFRRGRSTIDQIFTLRQIIEKRWEFGRQVHIAFVDLEKAYDSVWREGMWRVAEHYGIDVNIVNLLRRWYDGICGCVRVDGETSESFNIENGLRQGCVLSPTLFNIYMDNIMRRTMDGFQGGVSVGEEIFTDLDFADDVALLADTWAVLAVLISKMEEVTQDFGINISTKKTETMSIDRGLGAQREEMRLRGEVLKEVEEFVYLGSKFTKDGRCIKDIERRKALALTAYNTLERKLWRRREISRKVKMKVFNAVVLPILLYGATAWTLTITEEKKLDAFEMKLLRRMEGVRWDHFIRNEDIRRRLDQMPVSQRLRSRRLAMYGHVVRMEEERTCSRVWRAEMQGRRPVGRPRTRWRGMLQRDLNVMQLSEEEAEQLALDRSEWRAAVGASCCWTATGRQ